MRTFIVVLAVLLVGCHQIGQGYVVSKRDVPAHDQEYVQMIPMGQSCYKVGKTESCHTNYIYVPATRHVSRGCYVTLQNDKESGDREIDCGSWDGLGINDYVTLK